MADYWKSGERHFCTFCKCWLAGNKISIDLHERGNHHKSMVKAKLDQLRKSNIEKERQDKQFNQTLSQIERAANESFRRDVASSATAELNYAQGSTATSADVNLPSKLKRPISQPVQIQVKKPKFIMKTPTPKPVYEPVETPKESSKESETKTDNVVVPEGVVVVKEQNKPTTSDSSNPAGTWYESKTEAQESFFWNDTTGESTWTPPPVYLSIEEQRARGLKV